VAILVSASHLPTDLVPHPLWDVRNRGLGMAPVVPIKKARGVAFEDAHDGR